MSKKIVYILGIAILAALILGGFFYFQNWRQIKQEKIKLSLAENKFPYREYTQEELNKMYPQIKNADVPTRTTPEQTYAKFREALKTNNLELAIEQLSKESEKYEENKNNISNFYKEGKFIELVKHYSEKIEKVNMYEALAQYEYIYFSNEYNQELLGNINFVKDSAGDWKIDSL